MTDQPGNAGPDKDRVQGPFVGRQAAGEDPSDPAAVHRLPPPMFPPGSRRVRPRTIPKPVEPEEDEDISSGIPDDAFIMPDEPFHRAERDAWIDPDEPIVRTEPPQPPDDWEQVIYGTPPLGPDGVLVTGIGEAPQPDDWDSLLKGSHGRDAHVAELVRAVQRLAEGLAVRGEAALKATPDMTPFEATLRAYCVGFLASAREGGKPGGVG